METINTLRVSVSKESLQRLPLRGIVAFAAICARRVQPVFSEFGDRNSDDAVEAAIRHSENFAQGQDGLSEDVLWAVEIATKSPYAYYAALAAKYAAQATVHAAKANQGPDKLASGMAAAGSTYETYQSMLLSLQGNKKIDAIRESEKFLALLLQLNLGEFPGLGRIVPMRSSEETV